MGSRRFSLIEIIVVLAIVAMIAGVVVFRSFEPPAGIRVRDAHATIRSAFRVAQSRAMATGEIVNVRFTLGDSARIDLLTQQQTRDAAEFIPTDFAAETDELGGRTSHNLDLFDEFRFFDLPKEVELDETSPDCDPDQEGFGVFTFYPNGESAGLLMPLVILNQKFTVDVDRLTGRPMVVAYED